MQAVDWQVIVKQHGPVVWQTAYRLLGNYADTADCFQETFVCAVQIWRRQRVRSFPALLSRLATARAIDQLRQRIRRSHTAAEPAGVSGCNPNPAQQLETAELAEKLRKAITQLPQQQAEVFCLRYLNDMSYRLIAKQLGIRTGATGVLLHRARAKLRKLLEKSPGKEEESEVQL